LSNDVNGLDAGTPPVSTYIVFLQSPATPISATE